MIIVFLEHVGYEDIDKFFVLIKEYYTCNFLLFAPDWFHKQNEKVVFHAIMFLLYTNITNIESNKTIFKIVGEQYRAAAKAAAIRRVQKIFTEIVQQPRPVTPPPPAPLAPPTSSSYCPIS